MKTRVVVVHAVNTLDALAKADALTDGRYRRFHVQYVEPGLWVVTLKGRAR